MLVILEATAGPATGRKIQVAGGTILRVGRTAKSDYALGEDSYLSGQHFAIECDGKQCTIRDLGSSNGTFVNGDRVTEHTVQDGDSVAAGGSTFSVRIDLSGKAAPQATRPPAARTLKLPEFGPVESSGPMPMPGDSPSWPGFSRGQSVLLNALYREGEAVYAVLDAIRDARIPAFLDASGEKYARIDEENPASPYLVLVPGQSRLLDVLIKDGWNHGWGFYFAASLEFENALWHWRTFVTLHNRNGQAVTFRFWDPRVLRAIVPAMTAAEAAGFFGLISRFVVEGDKPGMAVEFAPGAGGIQQQVLVLV
ncbi:MAG: FHA domain-containing protein [Acidobacteriota bacterium]|nr:FHA domain-containing protein [Acidobacteriota bacterium]